ncbi:MAG: C39 family peptidase [Oscillospiraceae bacterium]
MTAHTKAKKKSGWFLKLIIFLVCGICMFFAAKTLLELRSGEHSDWLPGGGEIVATPAAFGTGDDEVSKAIAALAREDSRVLAVADNMDAFPEPLLKLLVKNSEAREFVLDYPRNQNNDRVESLNENEVGGEIPLLLQWDERWGYVQYGSCVLGVTGCGPTCLSMVLAGLSGDRDKSPAAVAAFSEKNGYYVDGSGSSWALMTAGAKKLGLSATEVPLWEESMIAELEAGHPIIANLGKGDFTDEGHFIVIRGYENGMFLVNDPNSPKRSAEGWYFKTLEPQIRNLWAYSLA